MVPGKPEIFPFDALTAIERCTLHQAISNTIMKDSSRDTNPLCQEIGQKLIGNYISFIEFYNFMLYFRKCQFLNYKINIGRGMFADLWNCPKEYGVILTPYGTIAPGAIIAAVAASLQHQDVSLNQIRNVTGIVYLFREYYKFEFCHISSEKEWRNMYI